MNTTEMGTTEVIMNTTEAEWIAGLGGDGAGRTVLLIFVLFIPLLVCVCLLVFVSWNVATDKNNKVAGHLKVCCLGMFRETRTLFLNHGHAHSFCESDEFLKGTK